MTQPGYEAGNGSNTLYHGMHNSRFETYLLAVTDRGQVISLDFTDNEQASLEKLRKRWSYSTLVHGPEHTGPIASRLFAPATTDPVRLLPMGTPFQLRVWACLLQIPFGKTATYQWVAEEVGNPRAAQAIGNAIGMNPVAFLIPCHRVVSTSGRIRGYRWGTWRKRALLEWENSLAGQQRTLFQPPET
jgi:AraC family transcriptional regulator of adaptative response/methylated-DNA-[protein]-cysteine methyltransferase